MDFFFVEQQLKVARFHIHTKTEIDEEKCNDFSVESIK